jgi:hypothetical protein
MEKQEGQGGKDWKAHSENLAKERYTNREPKFSLADRGLTLGKYNQQIFHENYIRRGFTINSGKFYLNIIFQVTVRSYALVYLQRIAGMAFRVTASIVSLYLLTW